MTMTTVDFRGLQSPITAISPLKRGWSWVAWLLLVVLKRFSTLYMVYQLEFIHFAHWQRMRTKKIPRLVPQQPREKIKNDFFVFSTNYNGEWDQYIDTFARVKHIRLGMKALWGTSAGFPGPIPLRNFKQYIHYLSYAEDLYYSAYPAATVRNIDAAIKVRDQIAKFAAASSPKETPAAFKQRYVAMVKSIAPSLGNAPAKSPYKIATAEPGGSALMTPTPYGAMRRNSKARSPVLGRLAGGKTGQTILMAMSPIEVKPAHIVTDEIVKRIATVNKSMDPSPFSKCPMLHFARLVVIDDLRPELGVADWPSLRTNYLLFIAAIDGGIDDFLDCLYEADPQFVQDVWGRCLGYSDDQQGPVFLRRYIERSSMPVQLPYIAFRNETALDIRGALEIHAEMLDWLAEVRCSRMDDSQLMADWQDLQAQFFTGSRPAR